MTWVYIALIAQVFNAAVFLVDKYLVGPRAEVRPAIYAFYVGILSGLVVWLLPFKVISWPSANLIWLSLATGFTYVVSLIFLYKSLRVSDASDVAPVMGAVAALSALFFSWLLLREQLTENFLMGFILLVLGMVLMSYFRFHNWSFVHVLIAGALFGLSSVLIKMIFTETGFWNGFFWSRMANVVIALLLLIWPKNFKAIFGHLRHSSGQTKSLVVANKVLAGFTFLLILFAIKLGDVSVVNAIGGTQFVFLIVLALIFAKKFPHYFPDSIKKKTALIQKVVATALIVLGYYLLFI